MKYCFKQTKLPPRFVGDDVKLLVLISNRVDVDDPDIKHFIDLCDFLVLDKTPDDFGEPRNTWTPSIEGVFCEVSPVLGRDFIAAHTNSASVEVKIRCRWIDGVKDEMRVRCGSDMYDIISAINVSGNNRELLCYCRKVRD